METKLIIAGFGGQGIVMAGQLLAHAGMLENKKVSLVPSYGPEMRGGTANCTVILKNGEIYSPVVAHPDIVIAMNQPSLDKFDKSVVKGGFIFYNTSLCAPEKKRKGIKYIGVPASEIATALGDIRVANSVILGALIAHTKIIKAKTLSDRVLPGILSGKKAALVDINRKALKLGIKTQKSRAGE